LLRGHYDGGVLGRSLLLGPSIDGIGLRLAFAKGIRGTPWIMRGSFMSVGSSLAGTASSLALNILLGSGGNLLLLITDL